MRQGDARVDGRGRAARAGPASGGRWARACRCRQPRRPGSGHTRGRAVPIGEFGIYLDGGLQERRGGSPCGVPARSAVLRGTGEPGQEHETSSAAAVGTAPDRRNSVSLTTRRPAQHPGQTGARAVGQRESDRGQLLTQQRCVTDLRNRQPRDLLGERHRSARRVLAREPPHQRHDHHTDATGRSIRKPSHVAAVRPDRRTTAMGPVRTRRAGTRMLRDHPSRSPLDQLHHDTGRMREQRLETPRRTREP